MFRNEAIQVLSSRWIWLAGSQLLTVPNPPCWGKQTNICVQLSLVLIRIEKELIPP